MKKKIGIVGYGAFGKLMHEHLQEFFAVEIFKRENLSLIKNGDELEVNRLRTLDYLIISVTLDSFAEVCEILSKYVSPKTIVMDVCSVKVMPVEIMRKCFVNNQIIATHPIFGPQSAAAGLENLKIVIHNVSTSSEHYLKIKDFLQHQLKLLFLEMSPEEHDNEMAYVQGLSHFIAKALEKMDIPDSAVATYSYKQLLKLRELIGKDSLELFKTIENGNPMTTQVRKDFLTNLQELETLLKE